MLVLGLSAKRVLSCRVEYNYEQKMHTLDS